MPSPVEKVAAQQTDVGCEALGRTPFYFVGTDMIRFFVFSPSVFAFGEATFLFRGRLWCGFILHSEFCILHSEFTSGVSRFYQ
jgi:hypothetical protein